MEKASLSKKSSRWWIGIIGSGIALSPIHNKWFTDLLTNSKGETVFFLPAFGYLLLIMGTGMFLLYNWERIKEIGWGDKKIIIPLLIIVVAIGLSGITTEGGIEAKFAPIGTGLSFLAVYTAARLIGKDIFLPLAIGVAVASLGIIIKQALAPGLTTGGFIFENNFDVATGFILLGAALFINRWRWLLAGLAVLALLLSGAPEAVFALGVVALVVLFRRDWSRKTTAIAALLAIIAVAGLLSGQAQKLYSYTVSAVRSDPVPVYISPEGEQRRVSSLDYRVLVIQDALANIKPLGDGYNLTAFRVTTVHNVPLVIVQQLGWPGMVAGAAWLWVTIFCLIKTKWKYAWTLILTLSVFDHYVFTQLAPFYWALVGVSTVSTIGNDLIFRRPVQ